MSGMKKIKDTREQYIFTTTLDIENLNTRMVNRIDELGDQMNYTTNVRAYTTHATLSFQYPEFAEFSKIVEDYTKKCSIEMNSDYENHLTRLNHPFWKSLYVDTQVCGVMWGSKYASGEVAVPHDHWPATWAWVYYIDPPENCPGLYFPTLDYEQEVEHGMLLLFSGNLMHEVRSQEFDGFRYVVAGSCLTNPWISGIQGVPPEDGPPEEGKVQ